MSRINVLPQSVFNRIAAGEVVDRPYSVVKELVENSIDAGATDIEIRIEQGGKQLIEVSDNGSGIEKEDLPKAFMPHATSKISKTEDLDCIMTLGFRGEALASIGSVSHAVISSSARAADGSFKDGYLIRCDGGKISGVEPAAIASGTDIQVRDLFYNTPARFKFMRPDKKEETDITSFVTRFILGNPSISFRLYSDGKLTLQSYGGGLEEAVSQVYGTEALSKCFSIDAHKDGIRVWGFIGNQNYFKSNKSYQSVFLNGRYIINQTIAQAVSNAYASYVMKRQFPFYVLNVEIPSDLVDVNVHPSKEDVRFLNPNAVFGVVYKTVSAVLDGTAPAADFEITAGVVGQVKSTYGKNAPLHSNQGLSKDSQTPRLPTPDTQVRLDNLPSGYSSLQTGGIFVTGPKTSPAPVKEPGNEPLKEPSMAGAAAARPAASRPVPEGTVPEGTAPEKESENVSAPAPAAKKEKPVQEVLDYRDFEYKGNLFSTYLIFEYADTVYFIDQHAAHERLIYNALMERLARREVLSQPLLFGYVFSTNAEEARFLSSNLGLISEIGFEISEFGPNSFKVDAVPLDLQDIEIKDFIDEILSMTGELKAIKLADLLKDRIAMTACKHAIKGGWELSESEIKELFRLLGGDWGLKCPHGRPICVRLTKTDIEKMFKRIV
ncbi:MAG: DNA mismatch repair endonuclease MutL [Clostridia bacterium]|nr:DNA mismatch repair endonuclease MutL [Clostridia bacterium]